MIRMLATTAIVAAGLLSLPGGDGADQPALAGAAAPSASAPPVLSPKDKDFFDQAARDGLAEIDLSRLAQKSANPDVGSFADRMIADHTKIAQRLTTIAVADGVSVPTTLDIEHQNLREKLANLHDGAFDQDYAQAMVSDLNQAIKLFHHEQAAADNAQLKEFAGNASPTLQQHRRMAIALSHNWCRRRPIARFRATLTHGICCGS